MIYMSHASELKMHTINFHFQHVVSFLSFNCLYLIFLVESILLHIAYSVLPECL